ncbi:uncharacterized protein LACBIDRAFT_299352 [Laccaria bicolor S238N-H82]|uniref:Predicted protein n=1 Tax=Laccaria bicolor (strain S238N-H82 / ATCC MYA-4686) TaxID=486041 RepID=B0DEK1_LACBS|nr:uncharacterized protein LACBIDRAFT_299352 [Laccaria bicolor S238N-H82]EDR06948.1 predicted protein [Laccaria bicolor S238N-H82]|eukprot:XP_001882321.1 predicted protein [Laccaria bicolor S238N-H82]
MQEEFINDGVKFGHNFDAFTVAAVNVEFNDKLSMASLLGGPGGDRSSPNGYHHHHHGHHHTHHHHHHHHHQQQYEDATAYENPTSAYRTHNIFDVSASSASSTASSAFPTHFSSSSTTTNNGAGSQPSSLHETYQQHPSFNSTLPAINSTMRYDPPSPSSPQLPPANPPPSSFHPHHLTRHTPSPGSRSRSQSRPPSSSSAPPPPANGAGGVGPARTTRARRNNSISGTSPPPFGVHHAHGHGHGRPHAIVIPGSRMGSLSGMAHAGSPLSTSSNGGGAGGAGAGAGNGWYLAGQSQSSASEYSLPTPNDHHQQYTPFVLSSSQDMHHHLPPLHHHSHHAHSHSLPKALDTQAINLMALPSYDPLPPQNQAQNQVQLPPPSHPPPSHPAPSAQQQKGGQQQQQVGDKQALLANEKRRRRRESHNAVERRQRDNINEKISELATLIPECMLDVGGPNRNASSPSAASPSGGGIMSNGLLDPDSLLTPVDVLNGLNSPNPSANGLNGTPTRKDSLGEEGGGQQQGGDGGVVKANKGMILRKSVEYIRYLQQLVTAQGARNCELEQELKAYQCRSRSSSSMEPLLSDSAPAAGGDGSNMILHDELHHFHHGHGHMERLPSMPEEGGDDGDDLMMGLEDDMGMGMKGSLSPDSTEGEREERGGEGLVEERGRTRGVRGLKAEVQSDDLLLGM